MTTKSKERQPGLIEKAIQKGEKLKRKIEIGFNKLRDQWNGNFEHAFSANAQAEEKIDLLDNGSDKDGLSRELDNAQSEAFANLTKVKKAGSEMFAKLKSLIAGGKELFFDLKGEDELYSERMTGGIHRTCQEASSFEELQSGFMKTLGNKDNYVDTIDDIPVYKDVLLKAIQAFREGKQTMIALYKNKTLRGIPTYVLETLIKLRQWKDEDEERAHKQDREADIDLELEELERVRVERLTRSLEKCDNFLDINSAIDATLEGQTTLLGPDQNPVNVGLIKMTIAKIAREGAVNTQKKTYAYPDGVEEVMKHFPENIQSAIRRIADEWVNNNT